MLDAAALGGTALPAPLPKGAGQVARTVRTSDVLRGILTKNPDVKAFSVQRILASIGPDIETSLMMFSHPGIVPVPRPAGVVALPTAALAYQLVSGKRQIRLPRYVLKKTVSRKALAVAIHAALPVLQATEKFVRPRWRWVQHASARRAIGIFIFLLAVAVAFPLFGFSPLHATSIFVMALGMAEQDGLAVLIGVTVGLLSLAAVAASGASARALRQKATRWLRKLGQKVGLEVLGRWLRHHGYDKLAALLSFEWSRLLLLWDPERARRQPAPA
jgi:hypothetical protein